MRIVVTAAVLAAFTPGYVLTQIPAASLIARVGAKPVLVANNLGLPLLLLALPAAAKVSASALWWYAHQQILTTA